jgi:hypothetical protein
MAHNFHPQTHDGKVAYDPRDDWAIEEINAHRGELISVLHSLLAVATAHCANKTVDYAERRLNELKTITNTSRKP